MIVLCPPVWTLIIVLATGNNHSGVVLPRTSSSKLWVLFWNLKLVVVAVAVKPLLKPNLNCDHQQQMFQCLHLFETSRPCFWHEFLTPETSMLQFTMLFLVLVILFERLPKAFLKAKRIKTLHQPHWIPSSNDKIQLDFDRNICYFSVPRKNGSSFLIK